MARLAALIAVAAVLIAGVAYLLSGGNVASHGPHSSTKRATTVQSPRPSLERLERLIAHDVTVKSAPNLLKTIPPLTSISWTDQTLDGVKPPCETDTGSSVTRRAGSLCVWGDTSARRTIYLVGDSQAATMLAALNPVALELHWRIVLQAHAGCPPWPGQSSSDYDGHPDNGCRSWVKDAIALVKVLKPQLVIPVGLGLHVGRGVSPTKDQEIDAMETFVDDVAPVKVDLITPIPRYAATFTGYSPSTCLVVASNITSCEYAPNVMVDPVQDGAEQAVARAKHLTLVDVTSLFCTPKKCALVVGDDGWRLVYEDSDHALDTYMNFISSAFRQLIGSKL